MMVARRTMSKNEAVGKVKTVGNWLSAMLLGNTRELIARIDERTIFMQRDLTGVKEEITGMKGEIDGIKSKVDDMFPKVDILWRDRITPSRSPRRLNAKGNAILNGSGIKAVIDAKKAQLLQLVRTKNVSNAYDAENATLEVVKELPMHYPDIVNGLKDGAFRVGASIDEVLLVGGIYLRDIIFSDLGFSLGDLDHLRIPKS